MLTWNRRDSTPLSAAPRAPKLMSQNIITLAMQMVHMQLIWPRVFHSYMLDTTVISNKKDLSDFDKSDNVRNFMTCDDLTFGCCEHLLSIIYGKSLP